MKILIPMLVLSSITIAIWIAIWIVIWITIWITIWIGTIRTRFRVWWAKYRIEMISQNCSRY